MDFVKELCTMEPKALNPPLAVTQEAFALTLLALWKKTTTQKIVAVTEDFVYITVTNEVGSAPHNLSILCRTHSILTVSCEYFFTCLLVRATRLL